jgi:DtxR family Mn-dependent transcriptional regulator
MSHFPNHFEENYLKALYKLQRKEIKKVNNIALAKHLELNPATVLEMVRKMADRGLVELLPDKSIQLTAQGEKKALLVIRKHRLWEVFLVEKLEYSWSEVHDLAEQLEHIQSEDLTNRLEAFLEFPSSDPHGDPIPDKNGKLRTNAAINLLEGKAGRTYVVKSFAETANSFLDYLAKLSIRPGIRIQLIEWHLYDNSCSVQIEGKALQLSEKVAGNILVQLDN